MNVIRIIYKLIILSLLAVFAVPVMFFVSMGSENTSPNNKNPSLSPKQKLYRKGWLKLIVKVIGLKVEVHGKAETNIKNNDSQKDQFALWIANHTSWMDIAVIGSQCVGFLSKAEVRKWPFIGWLGEKGGTVFIQRGGKDASQAAAKAIAEKIQAGDNILVFPEGTTTSGDNVKRFHARIFAPALDHQLLVQPIVVQYFDEQGNIQHKASWINQSFMSNLMGVLAQSSINVVLTYLPIIDSQQFSERRQLAEFAEKQIKDVVLSTNNINIA